VLFKRFGFNTSNVAAADLSRAYGYTTGDGGGDPDVDFPDGGVWIPAGNHVRFQLVNTEGTTLTLYVTAKIRVAEHRLELSPSYTNALRNFRVQN